MGKHTPGPWAYQEGQITSSDGVLAQTYRYDTRYLEYVDFENAANNGPLLAAASELLVACRRAREYMGARPYGPHEPWNLALHEACEVIDMLEAAISEAQPQRS